MGQSPGPRHERVIVKNPLPQSSAVGLKPTAIPDQISYRSGASKETGFGKDFLIIVNVPPQDVARSTRARR
jgi:hypothetical protein